MTQAQATRNDASTDEVKEIFAEGLDNSRCQFLRADCYLRGSIPITIYATDGVKLI